MTGDTDWTRRRVLGTGVSLGAAGLGLTAVGSAAANPGKGAGSGNGKEFGRVYANDVLWRTNVVRTLDEAPDPADDIYFLHDGDKRIVAREEVPAAQASPFVSESAPGDRDWNGGQWIHFGAKVDDVERFAEVVREEGPVASESTVRDLEFVEVSQGRPGFGPPNFFVCPLNGRA
jgi:hypothetical protein